MSEPIAASLLTLMLVTGCTSVNQTGRTSEATAAPSETNFSPCASPDPTTVAKTFVVAVQESDVAMMAACQDPLHPCMCHLGELTNPGLRLDQIHIVSESRSASGGLSPNVTVRIPLPDTPANGDFPARPNVVTIRLNLDLRGSYVVDRVFVITTE